ncbi:hypothetical protein SAPIO_CDS9561 [Scedosporium apiospermum]|uniref:Uncharacterized protein n=1 Tax=Pseudallescheria apiosperma TaxID=563466 RepID=A0A084FX21_PSEDA|nr:uncharacterized protein SAPIO_CDS9561 [Scedosporium apiospermum]KEZ39633.1 hypothetical protein SAPIO_CDS9561 [Scedosporium apiospermum]
MAGSATERFRPAPLNTSATRGLGGTSGYGGYYQDSASAFPGTGLSQAAMPYQSADYSHDTRQQQTFGAYNPNMMYPVSQTGAQNPYDTSQQFQGRQGGAMSMMPSEVPQYFQSDTGSGATASALPAAQSSSAYQQQQQMPTFSGAVPSVGAGLGSSQATTAGVGVEESDYATAGPGMEERWADYQTRLATVFQDIRSGSLKRASETLLGVSNWLLTQVVDLGLNVDDRTLHADRLKLWNNFNHAWLGLFQKQKDMTESEQKPRGADSLLSKDDLEKMGKELVRLCDGIERHGLVDYQYGVWEEQIITVLTECLDLCESGDEAGPSGGS